MDDIFIYSKEYNEHLNTLDKVLAKLEKEGFLVKSKKIIALLVRG